MISSSPGLNYTERLPSFGEESPIECSKLILNELSIAQAMNRKIMGTNLDRYTRIKSILSIEKCLSKYEHLREKYVKAIDKEYLHSLINGSMKYAKNKQNIEQRESRFRSDTKLHQKEQLLQKLYQLQYEYSQKVLNAAKLRNIYESPYQKIKYADTQPNTMRSSRMGFHNDNEDTIRQKPKKFTQSPLKKNSVLQYQNNAMQKIKRRLFNSYAQIFPQKLTTDETWINHINKIYEKQRRQKKDIKHKILNKLNML